MFGTIMGKVMLRRLGMLVAVLLCAWGVCMGQVVTVTLSGQVRDSTEGAVVAYAGVVLRAMGDSAFVAGTVSNEEGRFTMAGLRPGEYLLYVELPGYLPHRQQLYVGSLSAYLDLGAIALRDKGAALEEVVITDRPDAVSSKMDKQTYSIRENLSGTGGSALQALQNLPGVSVQDGKVLLRGNDKVTILIDGRQTALTGIGGQSGMDNLPASSIERVEIIHNPSAKFDGNGSGGIVNIILRQEKQAGFTGKLGMGVGLGALWVRRENLPTIRPQYQCTPKVNPSVFLNWRKEKTNVFLQCDNLYTQTLNKNEFVTRVYADGTVVRQQTKRNRNTNFLTTKGGLDWAPSSSNTFSLSGLYGSEVIIDRGDEPFFVGDMSERLRLWQFLEDEVKTTVMATATWQHKFSQPGHQLQSGFNYTFHREDERYFFDNVLPAYSSRDSFKLLSDEHVADWTVDYVRPLKWGRLEGGLKFRRRVIPTDMQFYPGSQTALDTLAGGRATYKETIPALYGNYAMETRRVEAEVGLRVEYVRLRYEVQDNHPSYHSDGYDYAQPFPNLRLGYKINAHHKLTAFYNRRVDRPNEVDIRIFPKYDDAEIIKVGNPGLQPQFSQAIELGYKGSWGSGYLYGAAYTRPSVGTITRIASTVPGSRLIYAVFQNAGRSSNNGLEAIVVQEVGKWYQGTLSANVYRNHIAAFSVQTLYPVPSTFSADAQQTVSWNAKLNQRLRFKGGWEAQVSASYWAADLIPQGPTDPRFSLDAGLQKSLQKGKGQLYGNCTDILNTLVVRKTVIGDGFWYTSADYNETQVLRVGYNYKF